MAGDQLPNGRYAEEAGIGKMIPFKEVTEVKLSEAIKALLTDPSYRTKAQELGKLLNDQIDKPLDRAVWWMEHLIRHPKFGENMRSPVHDLAWYQYFLLDVIALIGGALFLIVFILYKLLRCICCRGRWSDDNMSAKKSQ